MSRNSKNTKRVAARKAMSQLRKSGGSGPARTQPQHGKQNAWWQRGGTYSSFIRGNKRAVSHRTEEPTPDLT